MRDRREWYGEGDPAEPLSWGNGGKVNPVPGWLLRHKMHTKRKGAIGKFQGMT